MTACTFVFGSFPIHTFDGKEIPQCEAKFCTRAINLFLRAHLFHTLVPRECSLVKVLTPGMQMYPIDLCI